MEVTEYEKAQVLFVRRWSGDSDVFMAFHFGDDVVSLTLTAPGGRWDKILDSAEQRWQGNGNIGTERLHSEGEVTLTLGPKAFVLFTHAKEA